MQEKLRNNIIYQLAEILLVFVAAFLTISLLKPLAGEDPIYRQAVNWLANVVMLILVWLGLRLRGESWKDLGLGIGSISLKTILRGFLLSLLVFVIAIAAFVLGSIIMANITGIPEQSDMSSYDYLKGNLGMLLLTLAGVYLVSSFGEEVIYRGFLINRISGMGGDNRVARIIAVIISSVVFGLVHYEWGAMGMVQTGFMGLALGICYLRLNKRLWILVLAHAYMDTILMMQLYLAGN